MRQAQPKYCRSVLLTGIFAGLITMLCFAGEASGQRTVSVRVASDTVIDDDHVLLGGIAKISGGATPTERLSSISLGYAPNVGTTREISRDQIRLAIAAAGFAESEFALETPPRILVRRTGQSITQEQIRAAIEKAISDRLASDKVSLRIVRIEMPPKIEVAAGKLEVRASTVGIRNLFERFSMSVEIRVDGNTARRLAVNVEIEAFADVLVAARDLAAESKLSRSDVLVENRRLEGFLSNYLRESDSLLGRRLIKNVESGKPITGDVCVAGLVVKYGDSIRMEVRSGNLTIIVAGEARASGRIGDRIAVRNKESGAMLQVVILDEGLGRVVM